MQTIGNAIKLVRVARGLGQDELAKKSGVGSSTISHFELGTREPSWNSLQLLAEALGTSITLLALMCESDREELKPFVPLAYLQIFKAQNEN